MLLTAGCGAAVAAVPRARVAPEPRPAPVAAPESTEDPCIPRDGLVFRLEAAPGDDGAPPEPRVRRAMEGAAAGLLATDSESPCTPPAFGVVGHVASVEETLGVTGMHRVRVAVTATLVSHPDRTLVGRVDGSVVIASRERPGRTRAVEAAFRSAFRRLQSTVETGTLRVAGAVPAAR